MFEDLQATADQSQEFGAVQKVKDRFFYINRFPNWSSKPTNQVSHVDMPAAQQSKYHLVLINFHQNLSCRIESWNHTHKIISRDIDLFEFDLLMQSLVWLSKSLSDLYGNSPTEPAWILSAEEESRTALFLAMLAFYKSHVFSKVLGASRDVLIVLNGVPVEVTPTGRVAIQAGTTRMETSNDGTTSDTQKVCHSQPIGPIAKCLSSQLDSCRTPGKLEPTKCATSSHAMVGENDEKQKKQPTAKAKHATNISEK